MTSISDCQNNFPVPDVIVIDDDPEPSDINAQFLQNSVAPLGDVEYNTNVDYVGQHRSCSSNQESSEHSVGDDSGPRQISEMQHYVPQRNYLEIVDEGHLSYMSSSFAISQNADLITGDQVSNEVEEQHTRADINLGMFNHNISGTDANQPVSDSMPDEPKSSLETSGEGVGGLRFRTDLPSDHQRLSCKRKAPEAANGELSMGGDSVSVVQGNHFTGYACPAQDSASGSFIMPSLTGSMPHSSPSEDNISHRVGVMTEVTSDVRQTASVVEGPNMRNTRLRSVYQQHSDAASVSSLSETSSVNYQVHSSNPLVVSTPPLSGMSTAVAADNLTTEVLPALNVPSSSQTEQVQAWIEFGNLEGSFSPMSPDLSVDRDAAIHEPVNSNERPVTYHDVIDEYARLNLHHSVFLRIRRGFVNYPGSGIPDSFLDLLRRANRAWATPPSNRPRIRLRRDLLTRARRHPHLRPRTSLEAGDLANLRGHLVVAEDVMVIDRNTFYGSHNQHDVHRDMRLDVEDMSYEQMLALEEEIGDVTTGLSEEAILANLRQQKYHCTDPSSEKCCICQNEYNDGEDMGKLDCGHALHYDCIKPWLMRKNSCPICKSVALAI